MTAADKIGGRDFVDVRMAFLRTALWAVFHASVDKMQVCCQALFGHGPNAHPGTDR